jgi:hypothetical protein
MIAVGSPVSGSTSVTMALMIGRPCSMLPEKTETIFMPSSSVSSRYAGMNRVTPS